MVRQYGWRPGLPDHRHFKFQHQALRALPPSIDLRHLDSPVYDQEVLGSCHDDITEVLTDKGWVLFGDLVGDEKLATVDPDSGTLIFEKPRRLVRFEYRGKVYRVSRQNLDFCVTPDHKMLVRPWNEAKRTLDDEYEMVPMESVGWYAGLMDKVEYHGEVDSDTYVLPGVDHKHIPQRSDLEVPMSSWLKFLGIYLAEGTMLRQTEHAHHKIQIAASKEIEKAYIRQVLGELGINYLELPDRFTFCNQRIYSAMESLGLLGVKAPDKFVPEFVFELPGSQMKHLIEGHFMGDGCRQDDTISHYTSSYKLADDIQRLVFLSGKCASVSSREPRESVMADGRVVQGRYPEYRVGVWEKQGLSISRKKDVVEEYYEGEVFCAEVPTYHTLVTRRNKKILISGNCTANAWAGLVEFTLRKLGKPVFTPSRLFIYYAERELDGNVGQDVGSSLTSGAKVLAKTGAPHESLWWYNTSKYAVKPNRLVYADAASHKIGRYESIDNTKVTALKACLASGSPFVFGFSVYESFESDAAARTGIIPMPSRSEGLLGGHATMGLGYDDARRVFVVRNSWGTAWGLSGYFLLPYDYITNPELAADFWTASMVA